MTGSNAPCSQPASTCPWRPEKRSFRQSRAEQQQPHPTRTRTHTNQHNPIFPKQKKNTYHSEVLERPGSLNVIQSLLQLNQLRLDLTPSLFSVLDSLGLKGIDRLNLARDIIASRLEVLELGLDIIDHGLVLQRVAVVVKVDGLGLLRQSLNLAARVVVTLLEGLQGCSRLATEAERAGNLGPVEFQGGAALVMFVSFSSFRSFFFL